MSLSDADEQPAAGAPRLYQRGFTPLADSVFARGRFTYDGVGALLSLDESEANDLAAWLDTGWAGSIPVMLEAVRTLAHTHD